MLAKLNFYNNDKLFYTDTTTNFKTSTSLKEHFNQIKAFIINDIVLNLQHYEIRELDTDFDRDVDVDIYCTLVTEENKKFPTIQCDCKACGDVVTWHLI